jgi:5-methylcytosine-specific restriction endonuclease McrA
VQNAQQDVRLDIDHILAWDSGGETVMENLQTLCNRCNGGKSNLPMGSDV